MAELPSVVLDVAKQKLTSGVEKLERVWRRADVAEHLSRAAACEVARASGDAASTDCSTPEGVLGQLLAQLPDAQRFSVAREVVIVLASMFETMDGGALSVQASEALGYAGVDASGAACVAARVSWHLTIVKEVATRLTEAAEWAPSDASTPAARGIAAVRSSIREQVRGRAEGDALSRAAADMRGEYLPADAADASVLVACMNALRACARDAQVAGSIQADERARVRVAPMLGGPFASTTPHATETRDEVLALLRRAVAVAATRVARAGAGGTRAPLQSERTAVDCAGVVAEAVVTGFLELAAAAPPWRLPAAWQLGGGEFRVAAQMDRGVVRVAVAGGATVELVAARGVGAAAEAYLNSKLVEGGPDTLDALADLLLGEPAYEAGLLRPAKRNAVVNALQLLLALCLAGEGALGKERLHLAARHVASALYCGLGMGTLRSFRVVLWAYLLPLVE